MPAAPDGTDGFGLELHPDDRVYHLDAPLEELKPETRRLVDPRVEAVDTPGRRGGMGFGTRNPLPSNSNTR